MPRPNRCEVCGEPRERPVRMCRACSRSYEANAHDDGCVLEAILWAARRARWYAERRIARARKTTRAR
jgi:hypothetical protein